MSSRAVNLSPFHGRQPGPVKRRRRRWEDRPRGAEVSLKDELSLTHTLALFLTNTVCLPFAVLTHTSAQASLPPSLFTPNFSRQFAFFCSFFSLLLTLVYHRSRWGRPPGVREESWGAYRSQGAWLWDYEGRGLEAPKSHPSFPLIWKKDRQEVPWEKRKKKYRRITEIKGTVLRSGVCVCVCVSATQWEKDRVWEIKCIRGCLGRRVNDP